MFTAMIIITLNFYAHGNSPPPFMLQGGHPPPLYTSVFIQMKNQHPLFILPVPKKLRRFLNNFLHFFLKLEMCSPHVITHSGLSFIPLLIF